MIALDMDKLRTMEEMKMICADRGGSAKTSVETRFTCGPDL
ncbi:MAG: hypothetical protein ACLUAR_17675 [Pilosibacter sp.]